MTKKHIATYPLYGSNPMSLRVDTSNRVGTGYIYSAGEIPTIQARLDGRGHPLRICWRNDECWKAYLAEIKSIALTPEQTAEQAALWDGGSELIRA